jgi:hypothetical protein
MLEVDKFCGFYGWSMNDEEKGGIILVTNYNQK